VVLYSFIGRRTWRLPPLLSEQSLRTVLLRLAGATVAATVHFGISY